MIRRAIIISILLACAPVRAQPDLGVLEWRSTLEVDAALRKKRRYYRVVKRIRPVTVQQTIPEPETRRVRVITIRCGDSGTLFDDRWCHRVDSAIRP